MLKVKKKHVFCEHIKWILLAPLKKSKLFSLHTLTDLLSCQSMSVFSHISQNSRYDVHTLPAKLEVDDDDINR